ncbi:MAG: PorV/PorQ family protein [Bacteroidota bacterium]
MLQRIFAIAVLFCLTVPAQSQAPKYSNEFLAIGVGARALGMSNANTAIVNDVTSGYWNPAGLFGITSNMQLGLMHSEYFAGIAKYDYGALAAKIDATSTAGLSVIRFGVDDIPDTSELIDSDGNINYDKIKSFSAADYAFIFSYARKIKKLPENLFVGANFKIIHRKVGDFAHAWGFGLDAGAQYSFGKWKFGGMFRDVTSTFNAWSYNLPQSMIDVFQQTGNDIPTNSLEITLPRLSLGAARQFTLSEKFTALACLDFDATFDGKRNTLIRSKAVSLDPKVGFELSYKNFAFLRAGVGNFQNETTIQGGKHLLVMPNAGVGFKIKNILTIDYALTNIGSAAIVPYSNVFSLKLNINRKEK